MVFQESEAFKIKAKERYKIEAKNSELKHRHGYDEIPLILQWPRETRAFFFLSLSGPFFLQVDRGTSIRVSLLISCMESQMRTGA
jgi:hypothetical protein